MSVYIPSKYTNTIKCKRKAERSNPFSTTDFTLEVNFPTWSEAHEWLVNDRTANVKHAEANVLAAKRKLKGAMSMVQK